MSKVLKLLAIQDKESVKNAYYRAPKKSPHIAKLAKDKIEVKTIDDSVIISKLEETILYILVSFKYIPFWLIQQWYEDINRNDCFESIVSWVKVGLVWAQETSMGVFIRPTAFLFNLFKIDDPGQFEEIPFGQLNHSCAEEQIVFDIHMGNEKSELWKLISTENLIPVMHPLDLDFDLEQGTTTIREAEFRIGFRRFNTSEILRREDEIAQQVKMGVRYTKEFEDFSRFPIITVDKESGEVITQTPDIIIPIPRDNGKPKSFAIEIELSPKSANKYIAILNNYKNNIKFGKLFYLCGNLRIAKLIKDAFNNVKGLGSCELYLMPFTAPAQRLRDYSIENDKEQGKLLLQTERSTNA